MFSFSAWLKSNVSYLLDDDIDDKGYILASDIKNSISIESSIKDSLAILV